MARTVDWGKVPDHDVLPKGTPLVTVQELEATETKNGYLMYKATYIIDEPSDFSGRKHFENFVVGSKEHPADVDPSTFGARQLKKLFIKANVPLDPDMDRMAAEIVDHQVILDVTRVVQKDGEYAGRLQNRVNGYYTPGERVPKFESDEAEVAPVTPPAGMASRRARR